MKPIPARWSRARKGSQQFKLKEMESRPSSEWIRVENAHEAIIDRNDFDLVQRIRNLDTRTSPQKDKVYLFPVYCLRLLRRPDGTQNQPL